MATAPLERIDALIGRATTWLARLGALVLAVMMFMTFGDVIGRALDHPIVGTVDMTELFMGLIVYLGVGFTTYGRTHISVDIATSRLPARARTLFDLFAQVVSTALVAAISWQLWAIAAETVANDDRTRVWELPIYPVVYVMAAASVLMVAALALQLGQTLLSLLARRAP